MRTREEIKFLNRFLFEGFVYHHISSFRTLNLADNFLLLLEFMQKLPKPIDSLTFDVHRFFFSPIHNITIKVQQVLSKAIVIQAL